jgi:hypothetical protein
VQKELDISLEISVYFGRTKQYNREYQPIVKACLSKKRAVIKQSCYRLKLIPTHVQQTLVSLLYALLSFLSIRKKLNRRKSDITHSINISLCILNKMIWHWWNRNIFNNYFDVQLNSYDIKVFYLLLLLFLLNHSGGENWSIYEREDFLSIDLFS